MGLGDIKYKCDPNKNAPCKKTSCKHNPNAIYKVCELTDNPDYSTDGIKYRTEVTKITDKIEFKLIEA